MIRSLALLPLLVGCSIENQFGDDPPSWPNSVPPPVADPTQTDAIVQVTTPQVDILWMIDNSCSMSNEQSDLVENFPSFMDYFVGSGLDYHVGITSSDIIKSNYDGSSGTLVTFQGMKYLDPDTPNPIEVFSTMANLGTSGAFPEKGLGGIYLCLEEKVDTTNAGFYRDEAAIHTIAISDEPDYTDSWLITQPEFSDWYDGLKNEADERSFSAIVDPSRGIKYVDTVADVGGILWDLKDENWPGVLERLGVQAAGLKREYFLSSLPVPGTLEVSVHDVSGADLEFAEAVLDPATGEVLSGGWTYNGTRNSITFVDYIPNALSTVFLDYTLLASQYAVD